GVSDLGPGTVRERRAGRHLGHDGQRQGRLAGARVAVKHAHLAEGDTPRPEPADALTLDIAHQNQVPTGNLVPPLGVFLCLLAVRALPEVAVVSPAVQRRGRGPAVL